MSVHYSSFATTLKVHSKVMIGSNQNWSVLPDSAYTSGQAPTTICRDHASVNSEHMLYIPKLFTWSFPSNHRVGISVELVFPSSRLVATSGKMTTTTLATPRVNKHKRM